VGIVEILMLLAIFGIITAVGTYVYMQRSNKSPKQANITNFEECKAAGNPIMESYPEQCAANGKTFVNESQKPVQDETANWLLYEPPKKEYSIRIPDGWEVHRYQKESQLFSDKITYKAGTKAVIVEDEGGRDFSYLPFGLSVYAKDDAMKPTGMKAKAFKTNQGDEVVLYTHEQTTELEGLGPPKNTKSYAYWISKGDTIISITHEILEGETAQTELVEKAIATLEIK
jgi:hypothetical protein